MSPSRKRHPSGGYSAIPSAGNPRQTEAWALIEAARRMKDAQAEPFDERAFLSAVRLNWRLWTLIQSSLSVPESTVPSEVRANVLALSNFVDRHTVNILAAPKPELADVLIRINREIAGGLMAPPSANAAANAPDAAPTSGPLSQTA
jgi:flagellar protein FlaF